MQFFNVNREKLPSLTGAGFCTSTVCWTNGSWHDNWYSVCAPWKRGMRVFVWNYRATRACINGLFLLVFQLWTFNGWKGACKDLLVFSNEWTSQWGIFRTTNGLAFTSINIGSWQFSPHSLSFCMSQAPSLTSSRVFWNMVRVFLWSGRETTSWVSWAQGCGWVFLVASDDHAGPRCVEILSDSIL